MIRGIVHDTRNNFLSLNVYSRRTRNKIWNAGGGGGVTTNELRYFFLSEAKFELFENRPVVLLRTVQDLKITA